MQNTHSMETSRNSMRTFIRNSQIAAIQKNDAKYEITKDADMLAPN